jgi:hypothetical protein
MTNESTLTTRTIGETESALNGILTMVLGGTGLDELGWIALRLVTLMQPSVLETALTAQLSQSKKVDGARAAAVVGDLEKRGLLQTIDGTISTTTEGTRLFDQLSSEVGKLTAQMWEGLDPADLATAARMLRTITERANALLAG